METGDVINVVLKESRIVNNTKLDVRFAKINNLFELKGGLRAMCLLEM